MMTTSTLITPNPATDEQRDQIVQFAKVAAKKAVKTLNLAIPDAQRVIKRVNELKSKIIAAINELSLESPNLDYFAVADWNANYRITLTDEQVATVGNFPWSDATLNSPCPFNPGKMIRETHFAFVGVDITMMELQRLNPQATEPRFHNYAPDALYAKEDFATKTKLSLRWYLLLKDIVPGSEKKTFKKQQTMLPGEYEVPSAVAETAKDLLIYKKTGKYVNPQRYARTSDLDSNGYRFYIGHCTAKGIDGYCHWDILFRNDVGIGASRKFDKPCS